MSETATRLPLAEAREIADELVGLIADACERVEICGSIRRRAATVGDLDLVCIPRLATITTTRHDLFGPIEETQQIDVLDRKLDELWRDGLIEQRINKHGNASWGTKSKRGVFRGLNVDVNAVGAECLGMWLLARTGPSPYSHAFVTPRSEKALLRDRSGTVVGARQGTLPPGFEVKDGFRLYRSGGFVPTPTEESVYAALGWAYVPPERRR